MLEYRTTGGKDVAKKAANFGEYAKQFGWSGKFTVDEETGVAYLFARRGESETIEIWWQANGCVMPGEEPMYTLAGERIRLRNVSAAAKTAAGKPDADRLKKAARKRKRKTGIDFDGVDLSLESISELRGSLPFDDESDDDELEAVLHNRTIVWINRLSGDTDSGRVDADVQFNIVRLSEGRDQVHFCDRVTGGFRSVYLKSIVSVG